MMYKSPTNKKEYWEIVNNYWTEIESILNNYLPTFNNKWIDKTDLNKSLGEYINELRENQNPRIVRAFNAAWFACPEENSGEWKHKGWNVLCNLCSEEWALIDEKEEYED